MNDYENHRTDTAYEDSLIAKVGPSQPDGCFFFYHLLVSNAQRYSLSSL